MKTKLPSSLRKALLAAFATVLATTVQVAHATDPFIGNIVFVGDSITNGSTAAAGGSPASGGTMPSWRYDAWKHLLDSGYTDRTLGNTTATANQHLVLGAKDFQMVGSVNVYAGSDGIPDALATAYMGKTFYNIHEGHNGWRANGMVGSEARTDTRGSGYIRNWISSDGENGGTRLSSTASTSWSNNSGDSNYWGKNIMNPPSTFAPNTYSPDTVVIAIGTNDISAGYSAANIVADIKTMIDMYRESNANATFYVTYVWERWTHVTGIDNVNDLLAAVGTTWNTGTSTVNIFDGFVGYNATTMNYDNLHPGDQGGLIFASNLARAMGIGQRTATQARAATSAAGFNHTSMTASSGGWASKSQLVSGNTVNYLDIQSKAGATGRTMSVGTGQLSAATNFTLEVSLQMYANVANNVCSINLGNGNGLNGQLDIYSSEIRWMGTNATYTASSPGTGFVLYSGIDLTSGTNDFRIDWIQADAANGLLAGYYIWYNGVLIGEAMQGSATNNAAGVLNGVTIGGLSTTGSTYAAIQDIALDTASSYAPLAEGATKGALVLTPDVPPPSKYTLNSPAVMSGNAISALVFYTPSNPNATLEVEITGTVTMGTAGINFFGLNADATSAANNLSKALFTFTGDIIATSSQLWLACGGAQSTIVADVTSIFNGAVKGAGTAGIIGSIWGGTMSGTNVLTGNLTLEFHNAGTFISHGTGTSSTAGIIFGGNYGATLTGSTHVIISAGTYGNATVGNLNSFIYGGGTNANGTTTGSTRIDISGGTFSSGIVAGGYLANVATTAGNSTTLNITGGTFAFDVYGGGYSGNVGAAGVLSNTNINISGGLYNLSMSQGIYGGSVTTGIVYGSTNITIDGFAVYDDAITFGISGNIYGGSKGAGTVNGGSNITLQDFSAYSLSKITSALISGNGATTAVTGNRVLNLTRVSGTLASNLANFTSLIVSGNSNVALSGTLTNVSAINVQAGSSLSTLGASVTGLTTVTLASGANWTHGGSIVALTNSTLGSMAAGSSITLNQTGRINIDCLAAGGTLAANLLGAGTIAFTTSGKTLGNWTLSGNNSDFHGEIIFTSTSSTISASNGNNPCVSFANTASTGAADAIFTFNNAGVNIGALQTTGTLGAANTLNATLNIIGISLLAGSSNNGNAALTNIKGSGRFEIYGPLTNVGIYIVGSLTEFSGILTTQGTGANSTLHFGNNSAAITLANGNLFADGASIGNTSGVTQTANVGNYYFRYTNDAVMNANIRAGAAITQAGSGTLTLTGSNAYTGGTTVAAGRLVAGSASAFGTGAVSLSGGTLDLGGLAIANAIGTAAGTGTRTITNAGAYTNTLTVGANTTLIGALGAGAANLVVSGTTTLTWAGSAAVCYGATSMFTLENLTHNGIITFDLQGTTWDVGTYTLLTYTNRTGSGTYNWTSGSDVDITGALDYSTANTVKLVITSVIPTSEDINIHSTVTAANGPVTKANIGSTGTLEVGNLGTVTLTGTSIAGAANVAGGSLTITAASAITQVTSNITATGNAGGGNGIVDVKGEGVNLGTGGAIVGGTITVTNGTMKGMLTDISDGDRSESTLEGFTGTAAIAVVGGTGTLDNVTVGTGGLTVAASGIANVAGSITGESGAKVVVHGMLHNTGGTIADVDIEVKSGGTLKGSGTMGNSITVQSGGTHIVGNSPGFVSTGDYTVEEDGKAYFSFVAKRSGTNVAGTDYSEMTASDTFSLEAGAIFRLELHNKDFLNGPPTLSDIFTYNIVLFDDLELGGMASTIADADTWLQSNLDMFQLDEGMILVSAHFVGGLTGTYTNGLQLQLQYVPEPTTATLGILGLAGLLLRRRRSTQK